MNIEIVEELKGFEKHYSKVGKDKNGLTHFWLLNGQYDGYERECK